MDKPCVAIDRRSGTVSERRLFFFETVAPGFVLPVWFVVDNLFPAADESRILAAVLRVIQVEGLLIGARKSAGMGQLELMGGEFWTVELAKDGDGTALANPFQKGTKRDMGEFLSWIRGPQ